MIRSISALLCMSRRVALRFCFLVRCLSSFIMSACCCSCSFPSASLSCRQCLSFRREEQKLCQSSILRSVPVMRAIAEKYAPYSWSHISSPRSHPLARKSYEISSQSLYRSDAIVSSHVATAVRPILLAPMMPFRRRKGPRVAGRKLSQSFERPRDFPTSPPISRPKTATESMQVLLDRQHIPRHLTCCLWS